MNCEIDLQYFISEERVFIVKRQLSDFSIGSENIPILEDDDPYYIAMLKKEADRIK